MISKIVQYVNKKIQLQLQKTIIQLQLFLGNFGILDTNVAITRYLLLYFEIAVKWYKSRIKKNSNWNRRKTPTISTLQMHDIVKIDTVVL